MSTRGRSARLLLIFLVLCATVWAQAASLYSEEEVHHASEHCCRLCHSGVAPVLPTVVSAVAAPHFVPCWLAGPVSPGTPHEIQITSASSRAPPLAV